MTNQRVVAIGLDSADPDLIQNWIAAGHLPNFRRLMQTGSFGHVKNHVSFCGKKISCSSTEAAWVMFQTGVCSQTSGYWETVDYDAENYTAISDPDDGGYDYVEFPPFFALGDKFRVATFDLPFSAVCPDVDGVQVVGWGGHFPFVRRGSEPKNLLQEIIDQHGPNEILYNDSGVFWRKKYLNWLESTSIQCIRKRTDICLELLEQEPWDLMLSVFGETHGASHDLWFTSVPDHPLHDRWNEDRKPLLNVFIEIDKSIGKIADRVGKDVRLVIFSVHGMKSNVEDVANFVALPELLYRFNFPGRIGFAKGQINQQPPKPIPGSRHWYWFGEVWRRKHSGLLGRVARPLLPAWMVWPPGKDFLFPFTTDMRGGENGWMPTVWYRPSWPRMRSFCLPSFADGHIRINLKGRESQGLVEPGEYDVECERIRNFLLRVRNGRTGEPIVADVVRTRRSASEEDPRKIQADLVVAWNEQPADVVDSPDVGRIGPVPYYRTGGHRNCGFILATGPGIPAGSKIPAARAIDLGPTILKLMNAPVATRLEGNPIRFV